MNKTMQKILVSLAMSFFVGGMMFGFGGDVLAEGTVGCALRSSADDIKVGGETTLSWDIEGSDVARAYLQSKDSDSWKEEVEVGGEWIISGILDTRSYVLTVENADGEKASCEVEVKVKITEEDLVCVDWDGDGWGWDGEKGCRMDGEEVEDTDKPSCEIYTNTVATKEKGITLHWYYNGDVKKAVIDNEVGEVTDGENWKWLEYSGVTDFTMTVENSKGETATCTVEIEYVNDGDLIG